jgi:hypothetical protein
VLVMSEVSFMSSRAMRRAGSPVFVVPVLLLASAIAGAQQSPGSSDVAQANNPLANFTAFNVHDYYIGELTGQDTDANQLWARFAKPLSFGDTLWLMRASLPLITAPVGADMNHQTGLGDLNVFAAYLMDIGKPGVSFSVGPQMTIPTATKGELGSEKWSAGLVNVLFDVTSPTFQYGYLLSWQASFAGAADRDAVNIGTFQPFLFYQLGGGTYLRSTGIMAYDFEHGTYSVPIGFGIGQVIPRGKTVFNVFIEPQVSVADHGAGWPKWQIFIALNTQFK